MNDDTRTLTLKDSDIAERQLAEFRQRLDQRAEMFPGYLCGLDPGPWCRQMIWYIIADLPHLSEDDEDDALNALINLRVFTYEHRRAA